MLPTKMSNQENGRRAEAWPRDDEGLRKCIKNADKGFQLPLFLLLRLMDDDGSGAIGERLCWGCLNGGQFDSRFLMMSPDDAGWAHQNTWKDGVLR